MATRPWIRPSDVKEYTEYKDVAGRSDAKLEFDIARAEHWIIDYCNNRFDDSDKYPEIPMPVKQATILLAEAYAHNAVERTKKQLKSETFDDYSYTADSSIIDIDSLDVASLLDDYTIVQPLNAVTLRMRKL